MGSKLGKGKIKRNSTRYDPLSPRERSERMSKIQSSDTKPEILIRKLIFNMGYRYRLYDPDLPGHPDIVFKKRRKLIFINGCFWHQHGCNYYRMPKSRKDFWGLKLKRNVERDKEVITKLKYLGWKILVIWECQTKNIQDIRKKIKYFLGQ
jgi:DNA mismatch endonuclease, patch repair protein